MAREIKFRAWDGNKMLTNVLPWSWDAVIQKGYHKCVSSDRPPFSSAVGEAKFEVHVHMINDVEVMQYTGLKDKNGKEIYEGDIVTDDIDTGVVKLGLWDNELYYGYETICGWHVVHKPSSSLLDSTYEMIGNIHENPELLEAE